MSAEPITQERRDDGFRKKKRKIIIKGIYTGCADGMGWPGWGSQMDWVLRMEMGWLMGNGLALPGLSIIFPNTPP